MTYGMQPQSDPTAVMGRRIGAYVIDSLLSVVVLVAILALTKDHVYTGAPTNACRILRNTPGFTGQCVELGSRVYTWKGAGLAAAYGLTGLVSIANLVVLQGMTGASIGKMILGLRVVNAEGAPCGVGRAFVRWLILIVLDGACFLIGLLVALLTHPHRRVGDMAGGTYVVALASAGRPIPGTQPPPQYAYAQPGAPAAWSPPGVAPPPPGWGATPPPAWGAPTDAPPPPPAPWGAPAAPPAAPPTAPPPPAPAPPAPTATPDDRSGWGTPASTWTAPPAPAPPARDAPPPAPAAPPADNPSAPSWGTPGAAQDRSGWGTTPPAAPAATPPSPAPPASADPAPAEPPPAADPAPTPPPPATEESWWNKAFNENDDTDKS